MSNFMEKNITMSDKTIESKPEDKLKKNGLSYEQWYCVHMAIFNAYRRDCSGIKQIDN